MRRPSSCITGWSNRHISAFRTFIRYNRIIIKLYHGSPTLIHVVGTHVQEYKGSEYIYW